MHETCVDGHKRRSRAASGGSPARRSVAWLMLCSSGCWGLARADGFNSDRPGFEVSSQVVPSTHLQVETGFDSVSSAQQRGGDYWDAPLELRYGVAEGLEIRLETGGLIVGQYDSQTGKKETGYTDTALGTKWLVSDAHGLVPAAALVTDVTFPTGSTEFRGAGLRPRARLEMEWALPDDGTLGVMPGVLYDEDPQHRFVNAMLGIGYSRLWTQQFGTFLEVAGQQFARASDGGCIVTYGGGGTYLVGETVQFDFSVSRGADANAPRWTYSGGVSIRF